MGNKKAIVFIVIMFIVFCDVFLWHYSQDKGQVIYCQSDVISWKTYTSGDLVNIKMRAVILFDKDDFVIFFYKGIVEWRGSSFIIDRNYELQVDRVGNSDSYHVRNRKTNKSIDDIVPDSVTEGMIGSGITLLNIINIKKHTWLVKGVALPIIICIDDNRNIY